MFRFRKKMTCCFFYSKYYCIILAVLVYRDILAQQLINRVTEKFASCDDNYIYFQLTFERPFNGMIYTDGAFGVSRCTYVNGSALSTVRYNVTIPLNDCRSQSFPNGTRQNVIIVQQDARILEATDNMYIVTCTPGAGGQLPGGGGSAFGPNQRFTLSFLGITVQGTLGSSEVVTNSLTSLDYTVEVQLGQGPNGRAVDRVLNVGEPLSYVVRLKNLRNLDARVGRCWATDRVSSDIQLSDDEGCTLQAGTNIWNNFRTAPLSEGKILFNDIKTWAFPTSNRVNILCNLHICANTCPAPACSSNGSLRNKDEKATTINAGLVRRDAVLDANIKTSIINDLKEENNKLNEPEEDGHVIRLENGYTVSAYRRGEQFSADFLQFSSGGGGGGSAGLITAALNGTSAESNDVISVVPGTGADNRRVCLSYANFIVGIVLLLVIILISFLFIVLMLIRMYRLTRGKRKRTCKSNTANSNTTSTSRRSSDDDFTDAAK